MSSQTGVVMPICQMKRLSLREVAQCACITQLVRSCVCMSLCVSLCVSACVSEHPSIPYVHLCISVCLGTSACVWISVCFCVCVRISLWLLCVCVSVSLSLCEPVFLCIYCEALYVSGSCVVVGAGACEFTPPALTFSVPPLSGPSHFPVNPSPSRDPAALISQLRGS